MKAILQGWNLMRVFRLGLAVAIIVQGIGSKETVTVVLGVIFGGLAFANIGCCGKNGCAVNNSPSNKIQRKDNKEPDITK